MRKQDLQIVHQMPEDRNGPSSCICLLFVAFSSLSIPRKTLFVCAKNAAVSHDEIPSEHNHHLLMETSRGGGGLKTTGGVNRCKATLRGHGEQPGGAVAS